MEQTKKKAYKSRRGIEKRTKSIRIRLTESEYKEIKKRALSFGGASNFLRMMIFSSKKTIIEPRAFLQSMSSLSADINRAGNNINQLAKHVNIASKSGIVDYSIIERCREEIQKYTKVLDAVASTMRDMYVKT